MKRIGIVALAFLMALSGVLNGTASAAAQPGVVLTMGDSYEVGVPTGQIPSPIDIMYGCFKQPIQASEIVANGMGMVSNNQACAGATTDDMLNGRNGSTPQVNALSDPNIKIVRVSIGGNDLGSLNAVFACMAALLNCPRTSQPVKDVYANLANIWNDQTHTGKLANVYDVIKSRVQPGTRVLIEGYPVYFGSAGMFRFEAPACLAISQSERTLTNEIMGSLNASLKSAADYYGFTYVDPFAPGWFGADRDLCSTSPYKYVSILTPPIPFHPTRSGVETKAAHDLAILRQ